MGAHALLRPNEPIWRFPPPITVVSKGHCKRVFIHVGSLQREKCSPHGTVIPTKSAIALRLDFNAHFTQSTGSSGG